MVGKKKKNNGTKRKQDEIESKKIEIIKPKKKCSSDLGNVLDQLNSEGPANVLPTRQAVVDQLASSVRNDHFVIIEGPIGSGKTFIAKAVGAKLNIPVRVMQLGDQIDSKSLFGNYQSTEVAGQFRYKCSKFTEWLQEPCFIILEDIDMANPDVISKIIELAFIRRATLPSGDFVNFHKSTKIVATSSARGKKSSVLDGVPVRVVLSQLTDKELARLIIDTHPRCAHLAKALVSIFLSVQSVPLHANSRILTSVDLLRACARLSLSSIDLSSNIDIFAELVDCWCLSDPSERSRLLCEKVAGCLTVTSDQVAFHLSVRQPSFSHDDSYCKIGRVSLPKQPSLKIAQKHRLGHTRDVLQLMERIAVCVRSSEPVLLVGETGVGKTSVVQALASALHLSLKVVNLSPTSDSDELIEGYKPTTISHILEPFTKFYYETFISTFNVQKNNKFMSHIENCLSTGRYRDYLLIVEKTAKEAINSNGSKDSRWPEIIVRARRIRQGLEKNAVPFTIMRGAVLEAVQEGNWLLIDEINLASPECLDAIVHAISSASHPNFRLFACMNPATDAGKRRLPPSVRTKFTEFYVDEMSDPFQLSLVVSSYLPSLKHSMVDTLVKFYLNSKDAFPGSYSLRTLCRALLFAADNLFGSEDRSLYEAVCMAFLTNLATDDKHKMKATISKTFKVQTNVPIAQPKNEELFYMNVEGYWIERGDVLPKEDKNYVITKTVKENMAEISRIVCSGRFPILLEGETSAGKTSIVTHLGRITGNKIVRINNHEHTDVQEYMGSYVADEDGRLVFREGALVKAVRDGSWVILDELNLAPTDVIEALNRLLDDNRELFIPELNTTIQAHRRFRLFATQNPAGTYAGRKRLSRALLSRFVVIRFNHLPMDELSSMVCTRCEIHASAATKMIAVLTELRSQRSLSGLFSARDGLMTLRDVFRWAKRLSTDETTDDWLQILANHGYFLLAGRCRNKKDEQTVVETLEKVLKRKIDIPTLFTKESLYFPKHLEFGRIVLTIGMRRMLVMTYQAWLRDEAVLMVGETGGGKTSLAQTLGEGKLLSINCHERTETADFLGRLRPKQSGGFEWSDGVVILAMRSGAPLLIDEISLAEDSVLERLNPLFEEDRALLLSDAGVDVQLVTSSKGFQMIATMNPGGDYGKKELSKALRNRFTEVWSSNDYERDELISIFDMRLTNHGFDEKMPSFAGNTIVQWIAEFFHKYSHIFRHSASVRDVVACADIYIACIKRSMARSLSIRESLSAVFLDAIASQPTRIVVDVSAIVNDAGRILYRILKEEIENDTSIRAVLCSDSYVQIGPLTIEYGPLPVKKPKNFSLNAPTCVSNFYRIARGLLIDKPILLEGSPGCGKSSTVMALAELTGHPITRLNLSDQTDLTDLFGSDVPIVTEDGTISFRWEDGPVLKAIKKGEWVLLDEMNLASQSVLEGLNACFDHRRILFIAELNKSFEIPTGNGCRFFACQNPRAQGGNRRALPKSFVNRFTNIWVDDLTSEDIRFILKEIDNEKVLTDKQIHAMVEINQRLSDDSNLVGGPYSFNLRDLLRWLELYSTKKNMISAYELLYVSRMRSSDNKTMLRELYEELFEEKYILPVVSICVNEQLLKIGEAELPRFGENASQNKLLSSQCTLLSKIASCVEHNWLSLMIGPRNSGKCTIVQNLADLCGVELVTISLNSETDAQELIGSYEQVVDTNALETAKTNLSAILKTVLEKKQLNSINYAQDLLALEIAVEHCLPLVKDHPAIVQECRDHLEVASRSDMRFAWIDSPFVKAFIEGSWIFIEDVNLCSAAVLDRLNSCLESGGKLVISERQASFDAMEAHPNFRVFLSMDHKNGEISRAMRNRSVELFMEEHQLWYTSPTDITSLCPINRTIPEWLAKYLASKPAEVLLHFIALLQEFSIDTAARSLGFTNVEKINEQGEELLRSPAISKLQSNLYAQWWLKTWLCTKGELANQFLHCFLSCSPGVLESRYLDSSFGSIAKSFLTSLRKDMKDELGNDFHPFDKRYHGFAFTLQEDEKLHKYIVTVLAEWCMMIFNKIAVGELSAEHLSRTMSQYEMSTKAATFKNLPLIAGFIDILVKELRNIGMATSTYDFFYFCISFLMFAKSVKKELEERSGVAPIYVAWNDFVSHIKGLKCIKLEKFVALMEQGWSSAEHARFLSVFLPLYNNHRLTNPFENQEHHDKYVDVLRDLHNKNDEEMEVQQDHFKTETVSLLSDALKYVSRMNSIIGFLNTGKIDEKDSLYITQKLYNAMNWNSERGERHVRIIDLANSAFSDDQRVLNIPQVGSFTLLYTRFWASLGYDITLSNLSVGDLQKFSISSLILNLWRLGPNSSLLSRKLKAEIDVVGQDLTGWYKTDESCTIVWKKYVNAGKILMELALPPKTSMDPVIFGEEHLIYLSQRLEHIESQIAIITQQVEIVSRQNCTTLPINHPVIRALVDNREYVLREMEKITSKGTSAHRPEANKYFAMCDHLRTFHPLCLQVIGMVTNFDINAKHLDRLSSNLISFTMSVDNFKKITLQNCSEYADVFMPFLLGVDILLYGVFEILTLIESHVHRKDLTDTTAFPLYYKVKNSMLGLESTELLSWCMRDATPMPLALKSAVVRKKLMQNEESSVCLLWTKKQWQKWYEKNIAKAAEKDFVYRNKTEEEKDELEVAEFFANIEQDKEVLHHNDLLLLIMSGTDREIEKQMVETSEMKYKLALTWIQQVLMSIGQHDTSIQSSSITSDLLTLRWIMAQESTSEKDDVDVYRSVCIKELRRATALLEALIIRTKIIMERWPEVASLKDILVKIEDFSKCSLTTSQIKMAALMENIIEQCEEWEKIADRANSLAVPLGPLRELLVDWKKMEVRHWSHLLNRYESDSRMKALLASYPLFDALFQAETPEALNNVVPMSAEWIHNSTILDFEARVTNVQILAEWASKLDHTEVAFKLKSIAAHFGQYIPKIKIQLKELRDPADQSLQDYIKIVKYNDLNLWNIKVSSTKAQAHLFKIIRKFKEVVILEASSHFDKLLNLDEIAIKSVSFDLKICPETDKFVSRASSLASKIIETGNQISDVNKLHEFFESVTSCDESLRTMINYDQYTEDEQKEKAQGYARNCRQREVAMIIKDAQFLGINARKAVTLNTETITQKSISGLFTKSHLEGSVRACAAGRNATIKLANKPNDQLGVATRKHLSGVIEYGMNWMSTFYNNLHIWSQTSDSIALKVLGLQRLKSNVQEKWFVDHEMVLNRSELLLAKIQEASLITNNWKHWLSMLPETSEDISDDGYLHPLSRLSKTDCCVADLSKKISYVADMVDSVLHTVTCMTNERNKMIFDKKSFTAWLAAIQMSTAEFTSCVEPLNEWFTEDCPKLEAIFEEFKSLLTFKEIEIIEVEQCLEPALLFIQNLYKKIVDISDLPEKKMMEILDIMNSSMNSVGADKVLQLFTDILNKSINGEYPTHLSDIHALSEICSRLMENYQQLMVNILNEFSKAYFAILSMTMQLFEKGYVNTIPKDDKQKSGDGETDEAGEGGGMGEGKSSNDAKDVTDEMEETGQIEGLQDEEQEPPSGEQGSNEKPIDMEDDFAEDLQDIDKNEGGNDNEEEDDDDDEEPEAEDQMGDVEEPEDNQLDPKLWDDEEKDKNQDMDQDNAGADNENNEMAAKEDDPMAAEEQDKEKNQDNADDQNEQEENNDDGDKENVDERDREDEGNEDELQKDVPEDNTNDLQDDMKLDADEIEEDDDDGNNEDDIENMEHDGDEEEEQTDAPNEDNAANGSDEEEIAERDDHIEAMQQGDGGEKNENDKELEGGGANDEQDEEKKEEEDQGEGQSADDTKGQKGTGVEKQKEKDENDENEEENDDDENAEKEKQLATEDMEADEAPEGEGDENEKGTHVEGAPSGTKESLGAGSMDQAKESKKNEKLDDQPKLKKKVPTVGAEEQMDVCDDNAVEESQSSIHLAAADLYQLAEGLNKDLILEDRNEPEFKKSNDSEKIHKPFTEAEKMWNEISRSVSLLSAELAENLRLILEPQRANKMQGDYRTGKRLNMRRLIPYIASDYRKDRIWMRRTKRAQREYQVLIAVDDSASMNENGIHQVTCESVCSIDDALRRCDAGAVSVISFGNEIKTMCAFGDSMIAGPDFIQKLTFDQSSTDLLSLLNYSRKQLAEVRTPTSEQLLIIISDGRGALAQGADKIRHAVASMQGVTVLFVVLDSGTKSITELSVASFQGGSVVLTPYLQLFPFPFYVIMKSIQQLPSVLSESIRQWFEMTVHSHS